MKRSLPSEPPPGLVAYELEPGVVLFVHPNEPLPVIEGLTEAERHVMSLLLAGADDARIAEERGTSRRTVENQVAGIYRKLGVSSRASLAAKLLTLR